MITRLTIEAPGGNCFQVQFTCIRAKETQCHGTFTQKQVRDHHNLFCNSLLDLILHQLYYFKVKRSIVRIVWDLHVRANDTKSKDNGHNTFVYELRLLDGVHQAISQIYMSIKH